MHQVMNRRLFELFPLLLVFLSGALSAQSIDQQEFREIFDPYLGVWNGEYRIFSQQDELLNSFKVERKYWWEQTIMMEQVTYDFGDMQQTYFNRIVLSDGMPFSFVTDSPNSDKIRSALRGSSLKGTMIWTRVLPKGSLPVRISERIVKKGEERFIDFWGDQEAINNRGASMFVRVEGYLVFLPGSRDYEPSVPEEETPEPVMVPDEPVEPETPSTEPVVEKPDEDSEPQEEPVSMEEPEPAIPEIQPESAEETAVEAMEPQEEEVVPTEEPVVVPEPQEEEMIPAEEPEPTTPEIEEETVEEETLPEPVVQETQEESEPVMQPEEPQEQEEMEEPRVEEPEPVAQKELPPPPPMPNPDLRTALESLNIVGIRDKKGDECIVVDYMLLYRPGDRLDMETRCYFSGLDETHLLFKDEYGFVYEVPRKDKQ